MGSRAFLTKSGIDAWRRENQWDEWRAQTKTAVFLAIDGKALGIAAVADPIKETTRQTAKQLLFWSSYFLSLTHCMT
ncbi:MAG TPA: hypothetical protein PKD55_13720 [Bellilinea sp.]|nr:hypothetical protein [Bellilinea sp.]